MKLFLDANVLFTAAHNPTGKSAFVIELSKEEYWKVVTCQFAIDEAERNLQLKFPDTIPAFKKLLRTIQIVATSVEGEIPFSLPEKDRPIFLSARRAKCSHLLTGDKKHFGKGMNSPQKTLGITIQMVAEFLDTI